MSPQNARNLRLLVPADGVPSVEIGLFLGQFDDQTRRLLEDTADLTPEELEWQREPGLNTIGMLLAHIAIVEVFWFQIAAGEPLDTTPVLGVGRDGDGIPIAPTAAPPASLAGRPLAYFTGLLAKARAHSYAWGRRWSDADLVRTVDRTRPDGSQWTFNVRWILYHVLEHYAGHYGQILLLRHEYRALRSGAAR